MKHQSLMVGCLVALTVAGCYQDRGALEQPVAKRTLDNMTALKQHPNSDINAGHVSLQTFLVDAGNSIHCWFILEAVETIDDRESALEAAQIIPAKVGTIEELVAKLQQDLNEVQVTVSKAKDDFAIIRLTEMPLVGLSDYALDMPVTIQFSGKLHDFVRAIHEKIPAVRSSTGSYHPEVIEDMHTETAVSAEARSVREVLIDAIPLPKFSPLLWRATTSFEAAGPQTLVQYVYWKTDPPIK